MLCGGGDDSLKTGFEEKITNSALNKRLVEVGKLNYQDEANKATGNVYASKADKAAAQKEAGDWKETADKYVAALTAAREKAEATKAAAEKAVAEADKMLAEKPEDATAKAYKEKAQALVKSAESALERFPAEDLATGKAAQAEAEKAVAAANAATVKAEEKPVEDKPAEEKPTTSAEEPKQPETPAEKGFGGDGKVMTKGVDGGIVVAKKRDTGDQDYGSVEAPKAETKDAVLLEGVSINTTRNITEKLDWLDPGSSYRTNGSFTANVDFGAKTVTGTIISGDRWKMGTQNFTGTLSGSSFNATWDNKVQGSLSGGFYGDQAAEMAGRYSYNKTPDDNGLTSENAFGVFGGKKQ
ncbi:transferrin-binding protein-like solute binding protein [Neisseria meningitidis]|uniref:transferrin-binding protein-like solute binding protein n=1 Tax=Neisseria meningitidis TaxID=487 RepID=UPI000E58FC7B|nr:transferrin-binding protein-like solute binding protein [Neisseria meningitidis]